MKDLSGRVVVITGAGSGIGKALAEAFAAEGCRLALSDINLETVEAVAVALRGGGTDVIAERIDVADREAVHAYAERVRAHFGAVHVVVNNAGVTLVSTVEAMKYEDLEWLMGINFWGVVYGTKAFLPILKAQDEGHIVNLSSIFGIIGVPTQSAYNAAKFAVRGFTESLRMELEIEGSAVSCTSVHPGGIRTNIARSARMDASASQITGRQSNPVADFEKVAMTTPEQAARAIVKGVKKRSRRVLIGADARMLDRMQRFMPVVYQRLLVAGQRRLARGR